MTAAQPIPPQTAPPGDGRWPGLVQAWDSAGQEVAPGGAAGLLLVCEHASNATAAPWGDLGVSPAVLEAHVAWDPGALGLARALGAALAPSCGGAELVHAPLSRLIHDLNRSPDRPGAMPEASEVHAIPGNRGLDAAGRQQRVEALYLPFHTTLHARIARLLAMGRRPVMLTIHSFTPVWHGQRRAVEFGVIHDADPGLAQAIVQAARGCGLVTRLNEPYSAADHVTHTLRLQATPYGLPNAMLELRNDLIATPQAQADMAACLAPVLATAMAPVAETESACRAS